MSNIAMGESALGNFSASSASSSQWGQLTSSGTTQWINAVGTSVTTTPYGLTGYLYTDPVDEIVNNMFTSGEKDEWLLKNGHVPGDYAKFNVHVREKLKALLLAPKIKLTIKLPE